MGLLIVSISQHIFKTCRRSRTSDSWAVTFLSALAPQLHWWGWLLEVIEEKEVKVNSVQSWPAGLLSGLKIWLLIFYLVMIYWMTLIFNTESLEKYKMLMKGFQCSFCHQLVPESLRGTQVKKKKKKLRWYLGGTLLLWKPVVLCQSFRQWRHYPIQYCR